MNLFYKALLISAIFLTSYETNAQVKTAKSNIFDAYDSKVNCPKSELEKIFTTSEGSVLKLSFGNNFQFTGTISSSVHRYNNLQSVTIKSNKGDGLLLSISKRINDDRSYSYIGRIINQKYGDAFELKSDNAGNYYLNKIKTDDLIEDRE
jgi:hypothetical protein